jgi:hypothetical protein
MACFEVTSNNTNLPSFSFVILRKYTSKSFSRDVCVIPPIGGLKSTLEYWLGVSILIEAKSLCHVLFVLGFIMQNFGKYFSNFSKIQLVFTEVLLS